MINDTFIPRKSPGATRLAQGDATSTATTTSPRIDAPARPTKRTDVVERVWIDPAFAAVLSRAGLTSFESIMQFTHGKCMRALPDRENWRLELESPNGSPQVAYLKKHHTRTLGSRLRAALGMRAARSPGSVEAENIGLLTAAGIPNMRLIAFGERSSTDGREESFVLTAELEGFTQLDHYLRDAFSDDVLAPGKPRDRRLLALADQVADVAARFHARGYNHRDLYCCHFFIRELRPADFAVHLIDLQRVQRRVRLRRRWIVKDLAQLVHSAPRDRVSSALRMRFVKRYLGVSKLGPREKRLIRSVLAKARSIERKRGAYG